MVGALGYASEASATEPDAGAGPGPAAPGAELFVRSVERVVPMDRARLLGAPAGSVAHYEQRGFSIHGLPVRGAYETALVDEDGAEQRVVLSRPPTAAPQYRPEDARVTAEQARIIAIAHQVDAGSMDPGEPEREPELVYLEILGRPILVWETQMPLDLSGGEPTSKTLYVSAATGRVLHEIENVRSAKATVFPINPATTPEAIEVELTNIETSGPGETLTGARVASMNCSLEPPEDEEAIPGWWDEGECYPMQMALSNEDGDFDVPIPVLTDWPIHTAGDDLYSEVSMFYHGERFLHELEKFGLYEFKCETALMLANMRYSEVSESYPDLDYGPLNNAYYTNKCEADSGPTMMFGQGSSVDYAYDGDVVYHEMGHGMVALLTPEGLSARRLRPEAVVADAGGINESIADYFAIIMTGEPLLGDYVARFWPGYGKAYIRTGENTKTCPANTIGQVHNDGEPLTAALWATRKRVGQKIDSVVLDMLPRLPGDADLETAANVIRDIAKERFAEGSWSEQDLEHLYRAFNSRGLYDCTRIITDPDSVRGGRSMYLRGKTDSVTPFWPGPMQLRAEVPVGSDNLNISFRLSPRGTSTGNPNTSPVDAMVLIKWADEPMKFEYHLTAKTDDINGSPEGADAEEVIQVVGDWDEVRIATLIGSSDNQLLIRGLNPGTVAYVTLVNTYKSEAVASSTKVTSIPTELLDQGTPVPDAGAPESESDGLEAGESGEFRGEAEASCACSSDQGRRGGAPLSALALALLIGWRRRRG